MNLTRLSVNNPAALSVVVILLAVFGYLAIDSRPVQLLPELERPSIGVFNTWREAAPAEMEANIVEPQEKVLRNLPGLIEIESRVSRGSGRLTLTFALGTDMQQALINVINNLNQTPPLPQDADEPIIAAGGRRNAPSVASLLVRTLAQAEFTDIYAKQNQAVIDNVIEPRLNQIQGLAQVEMRGRRDYQVKVVFDPYKMAALGIGINDLANRITSADSSAGFANVGRRQYTVRFLGQYEVNQLGDTIIAWDDGRAIRLNEVATVSLELDNSQLRINKRNGFPSYYITLEQGNDSNTVAILDQVNAAIKELNEGPLLKAGLAIDLSFDASIYIRRAIDLVKNNLGLGVLLALGILWFFLRNIRATLLIGLSIPISLLVSFIALQAFNVSLNVISLAGLAFAVGLVLDASIIVQENIVRYYQQGLPLAKAISKGAHQVKGALFASTLTTIAIFLPILFLDDIEGQLFSDLALTLSVAVFASMIAALTIIPAASKYLLNNSENIDPKAHWWRHLSDVVIQLTDTPKRRGLWTFGILIIAVAVFVYLKPQADFLPRAKADSLQAFFNMPPGISNELYEKEIANTVVNRLKPYMEHTQEPYIKGYNLSLFGNFNALFIYPENPLDVDKFMTMLKSGLLEGIPDTKAFVSRSSLLRLGFNGGRTINVDLQGADIEGLMRVGQLGVDHIAQLIPDAVVRPQPGLTLAEPELQLIPNHQRINQLGLDLPIVARSARAMTAGLFAGEYFDGNERLDIIIQAPNWQTPEQFKAMPLATPQGPQAIGELVTLKRNVGPTQLLRLNGQRTISLQVLPPETMTIEQALDILRSSLDPIIKAQLPEGASVSYRGSADRLQQALANMLENFSLAILILFLVMAAIFKSPRDSLLVLLVMPLALAGGMIALRCLNLFVFQSLDMLTMIGFIILLGLVVNNAILLVSETRDGEQQGLSRKEAVRQAVMVRARPIYMSTLTSIFGMLPLVLVPGVGADIYRGLAAVIVGGMVFSALLTLVLMPSLLRMGQGKLVRTV